MWGRRADAQLMLDVHPVEDASTEDLIALGRALRAWRRRAGRGVAVQGEEELLQGRYPEPCEPFPMESDSQGEEGRFAIPTPWRYCFARVTASAGLGRVRTLRSSLAAAILPGVGTITEADSGHW